MHLLPTVVLIDKLYKEGALEARKITEVIGARHDKTNKMTVRPAKTQISLGIHPL